MSDFQRGFIYNTFSGVKCKLAKSEASVHFAKEGRCVPVVNVLFDLKLKEFKIITKTALWFWDPEQIILDMAGVKT